MSSNNDKPDVTALKRNPWLMDHDQTPENEREMLAAMFKQLYQPKEAEAMKIKAYGDIVASRVREKL